MIIKSKYKPLDKVWKAIKVLEERIKKLMAAKDDLVTAVTELVGAADEEITAITTKLSQLGDNVTSADVEATVTQIKAVTKKLKDETASLA